MIVAIDDEDVVLGMEFLSTVMPFRVGDDMISITHNGCEYEISLVQGKEVGVRISSLKSTCVLRHERLGSVQGWIESSMPRVWHRYKLCLMRNKAKHGSQMQQTSSVGSVAS